MRKLVITTNVKTISPFVEKRNVIFLGNPQIHGLAFEQLNSPIRTVTLGSAITLLKKQKLTDYFFLQANTTILPFSIGLVSRISK